MKFTSLSTLALVVTSAAFVTAAAPNAGSDVKTTQDKPRPQRSAYADIQKAGEGFLKNVQQEEYIKRHGAPPNRKPVRDDLPQAKNQKRDALPILPRPAQDGGEKAQEVPSRQLTDAATFQKLRGKANAAGRVRHLTKSSPKGLDCTLRRDDKVADDAKAKKDQECSERMAKDLAKDLATELQGKNPSLGNLGPVVPGNVKLQSLQFRGLSGQELSDELQMEALWLGNMPVAPERGHGKLRMLKRDASPEFSRGQRERMVLGLDKQKDEGRGDGGHDHRFQALQARGKWGRGGLGDDDEGQYYGYDWEEDEDSVENGEDDEDVVVVRADDLVNKAKDKIAKEVAEERAEEEAEDLSENQENQAEDQAGDQAEDQAEGQEHDQEEDQEEEDQEEDQTDAEEEDTADEETADRKTADEEETTADQGSVNSSMGVASVNGLGLALATFAGTMWVFA